MAQIDGNQPVRLNKIEKIFESNKDDEAIRKGLLKGFGKDSQVTYLLTHIDDNSTVAVTRDQDGHLTWTIGERQVTLGSSWWKRFKHNWNMTFSTTYEKEFKDKFSQKIQLVVDAYKKCMPDEATSVEQQEADALRQAEEMRLAQEAKDQRILGLTTQVNTCEEELAALNQDVIATNTKLASNRNQLNELNTFKTQFPIDFPVQRDALKAAVDKFNEVVRIHESLFFITDAERKIIADSEATLGSVVTNEQREAKKQEFTATDHHLRAQLNRYRSVDSQISEREEVIASLLATGTVLATQISEKRIQINQLKAELRAERGVEADEEDAVIDIPEVVVEEVEVQPEVVAQRSAEDEANIAKSEAFFKALEGLDLDEEEFYFGLSDGDRKLYDHFRHPGDGATNCSAFADLFVSLFKGREATRVVGQGQTSNIKVNEGVVKLKLGGEDAEFNLPKDFKMSYSVDKQAWKLEGKMRLKVMGLDINLDGAKFEIGGESLKITIDDSWSKQNGAAYTAMKLKNTIDVEYSVLKQDVFYSHNV